jgi:putative ABC transport system permease protein
VKTIDHALKALARDWRSGEMALMAGAITIAVAALTTVGFFIDRVQRAIELQATELLAADLVLSANDPVGDGLLAEVRAARLEHSRTVTFRSVAVHGGQLELSEVKAVEDGYPIRGQLRVADSLFGAESPATGIPGPGSVWADGRLLQALGIDPGETIELGSSTFRVERVLTYEPDRGGDLFSIAPRLLMNLADLPATGLILPGSRARYRLLVGGAMDDVEAFRVAVEGRDGLRVQSIRDERPELKRALERAEQFLGLAVLVSVALCGLAIGMSARRYAFRQFDTCAVMRCLGAEQGFIARLYLARLALLAAAFGLVGATIGLVAQEGLARVLEEMARRSLPPPSFMPLLAGVLGGAVATIGFAMPHLWKLRHVPPLRVFRRDLEPMPAGAVAVYGTAVATLALLTPWQSGNFLLTAWVFGGLLGTAGLLALGAAGSIRLSARLRSRVGVAWRYGIANLSRRAAGSMTQIVGLGLGATVMLLLTLIRTDLLAAWQDRLPPGTPNYFLINVQPDEVTSVREFLRANAAVDAGFFPMVRGRLTGINDAPVVPEDYADQRAQRLADREFNLTTMAQLQPDNRVVSGTWWPEGTGEVFFSVETGIAETLGLAKDDTLTFRIAERSVSGTIRNLRSVEWDSFNVNFFVAANPGALDGFPATFITSFHLVDGQRPLLVDLVRRFPSVTVIDVASLLREVRAIMDQVSRTIEFVFLFTLFAGLLVLFAALQTTHDERRLESAVLRSLGASRARVMSGLSSEFLTLGAITGVLAATAAAGIELLLAEFVFELEVSPDPLLWVLGPAACMTVVVIGGLLGTRRVVSVPPISALRET